MANHKPDTETDLPVEERIMEGQGKTVSSTLENPRGAAADDFFGPVSAEDGVEEEEEPILRTVELAWMIWERRRFVGRFVFAGLLLSVLVAFLLHNRYTAVTRLMPPDYGSMSSLAMGLPGLDSDTVGSAAGGSMLGMASRLLGLQTSGSLLIGVLQSRTVEDDIIKQFGLMDVYSSRYPEDAREKLEDYTTIKEDTKTGIITLSVEDEDPQRAAAMARSYVTEMNTILSKVNTSSAHRERVFIEHRLGEVKKELDRSAKEFSEFSSQNTAIDIPEQAKAMVTAAADLQAQLIAAESEVKALEQIYTSNNFRVRQARARVAELQRQLDKFGGMNVNPAGGSTLPKGELYPSIRQLPLLGVKYLDLYRRTKINEAVFELLTKQYELAKIQEARELPTAQILDLGVIPQKKSFPPRILIILGGTVVAFLLAAFWIREEAVWHRGDPQEPWKVLARDVGRTCRSYAWDSRVSKRFRYRASTALAKTRFFRRRNGPGAAPPL